MTPQTETITISDVTSAKFKQLHLEHAATLSCPCSTISMPYKSFVFNHIEFHRICRSFFVSEQWIKALYRSEASTFNTLDFRKTANSQVNKHLFFTNRFLCLVQTFVKVVFTFKRRNLSKSVQC
jgi:hypothetical protein